MRGLLRGASGWRACRIGLPRRLSSAFPPLEGEEGRSEPLTPGLAELAAGVLRGHKGSLSRAITLCESSRPDHHRQGTQLLQHVLYQRRATESTTFRIGISGPPGAGKSSLIERLGGVITSAGEKVAVLAIDPSSQRSGGSILGDKTRMPTLSLDPDAFVRPTSARGTLGGVARGTADAALLCEAAGHGVVLVETVGVGQSESAVADVADAVLLVLPPAGGDELQGVKRGIVEIADVIVVNKADGHLRDAAGRAAAEYAAAATLMRPRLRCWEPRVMTCSALENTGVEELWAALGGDLRQAMRASGTLEAQRRGQRRRRLWGAVHDAVRDHVLRQGAAGGGWAARAEAAVEGGELLPRAAADAMLPRVLRGLGDEGAAARGRTTSL